MSTATRDPVPAAQARVVISRSGDRCAYRGCGQELSLAPPSNRDHPKATGKVAHICAASPGGPRYDGTMTPSQRGSADNLIYLCGPHHDAIDSQLHFHTAEWLRQAKRDHERAVARGVRLALGQVTYEELGVVCSVLASAPPNQSEAQVELALPVREKIEFNNLGSDSTQRITDGLSQSARVADFVAFQNRTNPAFGRSLAARFRSEYYAAIAELLGPDEIFDRLVERAYENAGPVDTPQVRAAALAVVAYLFELCEIFERG